MKILKGLIVVLCFIGLVLGWLPLVGVLTLSMEDIGDPRVGILFLGVLIGLVLSISAIVIALRHRAEFFKNLSIAQWGILLFGSLSALTPLLLWIHECTNSVGPNIMC